MILRLLLFFALVLPAAADTFAARLYRQLAPKTGNVFFSPYSISTALQMTHVGARGKTADEMARVFQFSPGAGALLQQYNRPAKDFELKVANRIWPALGIALKPAFVQRLVKEFAVSVEKLDYGNAQKAADTINAWVAQATKDKIKDLVPPTALNSDTRLVLANAIYFRSNWKRKFDPSQTSEAPFTSISGSKAQVKLMNATDKYAYAAFDGFRVIELPYAGDRLAMMIALPDSAAQLGRVEKSLDWNAWAKKLSTTKVVLSLPRFKMTKDASLVDPLRKLGMALAFSPQADFSGISDERLWISAILHKAFIEVDEAGTEAAAATAVIMTREAVAVENPPAVFRADHTFVFAIRDRENGNVLFMGRFDG